MHDVMVLNIVGLTKSMIGEHTPNIVQFSKQGSIQSYDTAVPALTCTVQSSILTGLNPVEHGIVANGWYSRELNEIMFWKQSNKLVEGEKIWETAKKENPAFTCANLFWWYNMASSVDFAVTPRPIYQANGNKIPDIYTYPLNLRNALTENLGQFPLFNYWGPLTSIKSSEWIKNCALFIYKKFKPTLSLIYLPHLDYNLQRVGPFHQDIKTDLQELDSVCGEIIEHNKINNIRTIILSEYAVTAVSNPIHINRVLRLNGYLHIRNELNCEILDPGSSRAFAVCDHQVAHIYISEPYLIPEIASLLESLNGVEYVLQANNKDKFLLNHHRSGDLIVFSKSDSWFSYYYWLDDDFCPDFARTVDIHRKPGYDPVELFIDPTIYSPKLKIAYYLLKKRLGFRALMDIIPLDASLVKGSHGAIWNNNIEKPLLISSEPDLLTSHAPDVTEIKNILMSHIFTN